MEDIVQDVTYYDEMDGSYAFIITSEGILLFQNNSFSYNHKIVW